MMKLFDIGNKYIEESDWKILAGVKFCLFSMGMMVGMKVPEKHKKLVYAASIIVFLSTYTPLMYKLFDLIRRELGKEE